MSVIFLEASQSAAGFIETVNQFYENLESQESFEYAHVWSMLTDDEEYKIAFRKVLKLIWTFAATNWVKPIVKAIETLFENLC